MDLKFSANKKKINQKDSSTKAIRGSKNKTGASLLPLLLTSIQ